MYVMIKNVHKATLEISEIIKKEYEIPKGLSYFLFFIIILISILFYEVLKWIKKIKTKILVKN